LEIYIFEFVLALLLVMGGIQINPGLIQHFLTKISHVLEYMKNRKKKQKIINGFLEDHKKNMNELNVPVIGVDAKMDQVRWLN
jgi:hypothetical protein